MNGVKSFVADERGVSEVVGYAISFSIILLLTVLVLTTATGFISDRTSNGELQAATYIFNQLDDNVRDVQTGQEQARLRSEVPSGQLSQLPATEIIVDPGGRNERIETHVLEYETPNDDRVVYTGVFTSSLRAGQTSDAAAILNTHTETYSDSRQVLLVPAMDATSNGLATYSSQSPNAQTFTINETNNAKRAEAYTFSGGQTIEIEVTPQAETGWVNYFEENEMVDSVSESGGTVTAEVVIEPDESFSVVSEEMTVEF